MNSRTLVLSIAVCLVSVTQFALASNPVVVSVEASQQGAVSTISGSVVPYKEVTLTAQLPGRVELLGGVEGTALRQGEVLVAIDDDDLLARRQAVQAQLANAQAALQNAQVQYSRELYAPQTESLSKMPGMGMPSLFDNMFTRNMGDMMGVGDTDLERHADLHSAMNVVNQARGALMLAQSQLQEIDTHLRDAKSIAPFDGIILKKFVEVGDTVQPGQPLLSFAHVTYLRLQAEVPARLVRSLQPGMMVTARLDNGVRTEARVAQVFPVADSVKHTVTVKFDLPQSVKASPGLYAEVMVPESGDGGGTKQLLVPETALIKGRTLPSVLVLDGADSSILRLVRLGPKTGDGRVVVLSGLQEGERIIDNPPSGVKSGWVPN